MKSFLKVVCKISRFLTILYGPYLLYQARPYLRGSSSIDRLILEIALIALAALGLKLVMAIGEFDFTVGIMSVFGGMAAGYLISWRIPVLAAFLVSILLCLTLGFITGAAISKLNASSSFFTFVTASILSYICQSIKPEPTLDLSRSATLHRLNGLAPYLIFVLFALVWFVFHYQKGVKLTALKEFLKSGTHVWLYKGVVFGLCAFFTGLSGMLKIAEVPYVSYSTPDIILLKVCGAVLLGRVVGFKIFDGFIATLYGAFIIGMLFYLGQSLGIFVYANYTVLARPILFALIYDGVYRYVNKPDFSDEESLQALEMG